MIDEDRPIEKPGVMNTGSTRWKCPVCENICICPKCLKAKNLPQVTAEDLKDIHKAIKNKFPNVWTYLIYTRDHPNGTGDNNEDEDEESGETNNNNNNNNSNKNDAMEEDSAEEVFQKPKKKKAAEKKETKEKKEKKEKTPKKAKKNIIEEEEFVVEAILDKRKRKVRIESDPLRVIRVLTNLIIGSC